jgi:hypothetical protein
MLFFQFSYIKRLNLMATPEKFRGKKLLECFERLGPGTIYALKVSLELL